MSALGRQGNKQRLMTAIITCMYWPMSSVEWVPTEHLFLYFSVCLLDLNTNILWGQGQLGPHVFPAQSDITDYILLLLPEQRVDSKRQTLLYTEREERDLCLLFVFQHCHIQFLILQFNPAVDFLHRDLLCLFTVFGGICQK